MLFLTFEPYNNDETNDLLECFICFENKNEENQEPLNLKTQIYYLKNCNCNGSVHKKCLDIWYDKNQKCPICREFIDKNKVTSFIAIKIFNTCPLIYLLYVFYIKKIKSPIILFLFLLFIYFTVDSYIVFFSMYDSYSTFDTLYSNENYENYENYENNSL